jgi:peptidoglycan hydrolase-like protein with peptidoglycan-binding domain
MMEKKMNKNFCWMVFIFIILGAFLITGCPKATQAPTPPSEEKKETPETVSPPKKPDQEPGPVSPTTPSPAPVTPPPFITTQPLPPPSPLSSVADTKQKSIASGETFLDLTRPEEAKMIQTRLSELGLYKGPIDGIWGKGSQAALRAFKEQNSLSSPGKWDKETQMLLFREVPPTSEAMQKLISSGEILLNPGIPHDAKLVQTRLAELGLYKGSIDGKWGKGSQAALKAFKEKNSLKNPDLWDKETQMRLFR